MNPSPPAYDLAPLLQMLLLGVVVALAPLLWVWRRNRGGNARRRRWRRSVLALAALAHHTEAWSLTSLYAPIAAAAWAEAADSAAATVSPHAVT